MEKNEVIEVPIPVSNLSEDTWTDLLGKVGGEVRLNWTDEVKGKVIRAYGNVVTGELRLTLEPTKVKLTKEEKKLGLQDVLDILFGRPETMTGEPKEAPGVRIGVIGAEKGESK